TLCVLLIAFGYRKCAANFCRSHILSFHSWRTIRTRAPTCHRSLRKILGGTPIMSAFDQTMPAGAAMPGLLDRARIIAAAGFNRWLVPPSALCIHLCIGMAYGFSVFWLPLSRAIGLTSSKSCPDLSIIAELFTTRCDWKVASLGWMYTLFFVFL